MGTFAKNDIDKDGDHNAPLEKKPALDMERRTMMSDAKRLRKEIDRLNTKVSKTTIARETGPCTSTARGTTTHVSARANSLGAKTSRSSQCASRPRHQGTPH